MAQPFQGTRTDPIDRATRLIGAITGRDGTSIATTANPVPVTGAVSGTVALDAATLAALENIVVSGTVALDAATLAALENIVVSGTVALDGPTLAALELVGVKGQDGAQIAADGNPFPIVPLPASDRTGGTPVAVSDTLVGAGTKVIYTVANGKTLYIYSAWVAARKSGTVTASTAAILAGGTNILQIYVPGALVLLNAVGTILGTQQEGTANGSIAMPQPTIVTAGNSVALSTGTGTGASETSGGFVGVLV